MVFTRLWRLTAEEMSVLAERNGYSKDAHIYVDQIKRVRKYSDAHLGFVGATLQNWGE
jgi:hypothetical protein